MSADDRRHFLSEAECHDIIDRLSRFSVGGGDTTAVIASTWTGNVRWARNQISTSGDVRTDHVVVVRDIEGARNRMVIVNATSDAALLAAVRRAERLALLEPQHLEADLSHRYDLEPQTNPSLFSEVTYQLDSRQRASVARTLAQSSVAAGMLSAGYIEVSANSVAQMSSTGQSRYFQYTAAQCSLTVRDPQGTGSGWAGVDCPDWARIDGAVLTATALDKCLRSRNPVRIEPGRYVTILEPQAVCDFVSPLMPYLSRWDVDQSGAELNARHPFGKKDRQTNPELKGSHGLEEMTVGVSKLGDRVMDERISISSDPMDPDLGFPPFGVMGNYFDVSAATNDVYHAAKWVTNGVLTQLAYPREYGVQALGESTGLPSKGAFRMGGGSTSMAEMIATTKRGVLVTRFDRVEEMERRSMLYRGYTRDGLWLIENGKISTPVKNLIFTESILFALNKVEQLGAPQRVFHPRDPVWWDTPSPVIVPPLKISDFNFSAMTDAI